MTYQVKIAVIGYSGSGKSTLARKLSAMTGAEVLHFDSVYWMPGWEHRSREEMRAIISGFLDRHDDWVIDGTYSKICFERRMAEADRIVLLQFSALSCLWRVWKRYRTHKGCTRPDMGEGCTEKLDAEFVRWVLRKGRTGEAEAVFRQVRDRYPSKVVLIRNQRQLERYEKECSLCLN